MERAVKCDRILEKCWTQSFPDTVVRFTVRQEVSCICSTRVGSVASVLFISESCDVTRTFIGYRIELNPTEWLVMKIAIGTFFQVFY